MHTWSTKSWISDYDFTRLREHYGENVTLYFAFTQFYCVWLIPLSLFGVLSYFFFSAYDPIYGVILGIWTIAFKHAWERRQRELAVQWGVKGFTRLVEQRRAAYVTEGERIDPITGQKVGWFPKYDAFINGIVIYHCRWKSLLRRMLFIPFGMASAVILTAILTFLFAGEIYLNEVYDGPFKEFLVSYSEVVSLIQKRFLLQT